jgi:hypothetical protein
MFKLGDRLLFATEKCTYGIKVADQIDPERKNPSLPHNVQQKIFDHGINSELLRNTLVLAKVMFRKEFLNIDLGRAMQFAFDALAELVAMDDAVQEFKAAEQAAIEKARQPPQHARSLTIPSVGNVQTHCKTVIQKADHFAAALLKIARLFYKGEQQMNWDDFRELAKTQYVEDDKFFQVLVMTTPFLKLVRNARDCLEHHLKGVVTTDFELQQDGTIAPPTIAIDFRQTSQERCPISWFMEETERALLSSFEMIVVHLCSKHIQPVAGMPIIVGLIPENLRAALQVRIAYGMYYQDGQFVPIG